MSEQEWLEKTADDVLDYFWRCMPLAAFPPDLADVLMEKLDDSIGEWLDDWEASHE